MTLFLKYVKEYQGAEERFILCRSEGRRQKERAILNRFVERLEKALNKLVLQAQEGKIRNRQKVERRIGRLMERYSRAASLFEISVEEISSAEEVCLTIEVQRREERYEWALHTSGSYLLRTNWNEGTPKAWWKSYIQLTQAEDAFRVTKSDLGIRPIYHQRADRTAAHILVCFLALAMWRTLQQWMSASGLGTAPRKLLEEMREVRSMDLLLHHLKLPLPNRPKMIQNVVPILAPSES